MRWAAAAAFLIFLGGRVAADVTVRAPAAGAWADRCQERLRRAAEKMIAGGLPGPIYAWRERATDWGALDYDAFIAAAAKNPTLRRGLDHWPAGEGEGLVFAVGDGMRFRVVLIPIACSPRAAHGEPWYDKKKYWDRDEWDAQIHGVSATIHVDPALPALARKFFETLRPIVDECLAARPESPPERACPATPG